MCDSENAGRQVGALEEEATADVEYAVGAVAVDSRAGAADGHEAKRRDVQVSCRGIVFVRTGQCELIGRAASEDDGVKATVVTAAGRVRGEAIKEADGFAKAAEAVATEVQFVGGRRDDDRSVGQRRRSRQGARGGEGEQEGERDER